ncbi:ABC transporter ATP-binding protein [Patescibacteria group bacterium]|nr:ABC transporter ATP-binding protein [Patescibacteria group bacterium]MBU4477615.1 ABC transporter ATP-binding protein [Candidatus Omnitrophota bacterium]
MNENESFDFFVCLVNFVRGIKQKKEIVMNDFESSISSDAAVRVEHVSKKYCKSLRRSMFYGIQDIMRNSVGLPARSEKLRKDEFWALDDVSFDLKKGETLGIIGPNGSGKTTLLKMINGIFWPDKGKITVKGRVGALIEVGAGFHPLLSGRDNIYVNAAILGMNKREVDKKFDAIVAFADIGDFLDTPVKYYSSGMFVRLGFAVAVHCEPDILLVDEVLAVGDTGFQNKCFNKIGELKKNGTTTILVSHNMHVISTFTGEVVFLNKGRAEYFNSVAEGVKEYTKSFVNEEDLGIEKICSGNDKIKFHEIDINKRIFSPGESFSIAMNYESLVDYAETDIDIAILSSNEPGFYFQATNKAYNKKVDLKKGKHALKIKIENILINNSMAKIMLAIWSQNRSELLFWWRIPVEFKGINYSTGKNFLSVIYEGE